MINNIATDKIFTIVTCRDKPGPDIARIRREKLPEHLVHIEETLEDIMLAGPIFAPDGASICGSILIYKTNDQKKAQTLLEADPYYKAAIWQDITYDVFYGAAGKAVGGLSYK
ncbi:MAG: hypothetical protein JKY45_00105 [Emcibacter sp.]|nr:hypothetical protein [Emcibacter sp.]